MKVINGMIIFLVIGLNLAFVRCKQKTDTTLLSYVYKYEIKTTQDNAEVILQVSNKNNQLTSSYQQISSLISLIRQLTQNYCQNYKLKQNPCNTTLEIINQETETLYKVINKNKKMVFSNFLHKQVLKMKVINAKNVAHLIDQVLKISQDISMVSLDWLPPNDNQLFELALKDGVQQGFKLCGQINGQLQKVVKIEEIANFQVQQFDKEKQLIEQQEQLNKEEDDQTNQQQEQQKNEKSNIEWKFQVLCKIN